MSTEIKWPKTKSRKNVDPVAYFRKQIWKALCIPSKIIAAEEADKNKNQYTAIQRCAYIQYQHYVELENLKRLFLRKDLRHRK